MVTWKAAKKAAVAALGSLSALTAAAGNDASPGDFKVHSISVQHELGGSIHQTSQLHLIEQPHTEDSPSRYVIGLSAQEAAALSWSEVNLKLGPGVLPDQRATVDLAYRGSSAGGDDASEITHLYSLDLPPRFLQQVDPSLNVGRSNITIAVDLAFHHLSDPLPRAIGQKEDASLLWQGDAVPRTVYGAGKVRVKARSAGGKIHSYSLTDDLDSDKVTNSGGVVTFGPYEDIPPLSLRDSKAPPLARVHYQYEQPIVAIVQLDRHAEVSHWGDNLAIQDRIWMRNDGPALKGHFSRVDHQVGVFYGGTGKNLITDFGLNLPSGARDPYFVDQIGNVSTSHFRPSSADSSLVQTPSYQLSTSQASHLRLQPRYPMLGGWNYTFTIGWNLPLGQGGWGKRLLSPSGSSSNEYSVAVPFWNAIKSTPADLVRTRVVLPEGAKLVSVEVPFELDTQEQEGYTTYLDTIGRPAVVLEKRRVSEHHSGNVYLRYTLEPSAHFLKPVSVASAALVLFSTGVVFRRLQARSGAK